MDLVGFLLFILIGLAAGWLAGLIMKAPQGSLLYDLLVGVIGALLGGALSHLIGLHASGLLGSLVVATVGAILFILILRVLKR